ncbi:MAG TPA: hypothetical protein VFQ80_06990, partial [Thermomicrobiales bacterium]|nr:hypothetical protein [Thermomicrobiales bacterium]
MSRPMPGRFALKPRRSGPAPFSSAWLQTPSPLEPAPEPPRFALPGWAPEERVISSGLVLLVALLIALLAGFGARGTVGVDTQHAPPPSVAAMSAPQPAPNAAIPALQSSPLSDVPEAASVASPAAIVAASAPTAPPAVAMAIDTPTPAPPPADGSLLPTYRIITYYGHPHD